MLFHKLLGILDEKKQIQVYTEDGFTKTLSKEEWERETDFFMIQVIKVKDRPTDRYVYVEIAKPETATKKAEAYISGCYNKELGVYGCGLVLLIDGSKPEEIFNAGPAYPKKHPEEDWWVLRGEAAAAKMAIISAAEADVTDLTIHVCRNAECWLGRSLKTNRGKKINIQFAIATGETADLYSIIADGLAKYGAKITAGYPDTSALQEGR